MNSSYSPHKITRNLYQLGIVSLVVVVIWIGYELYYTFMTPIEVDTNEVDLTPLSSELYIETAELLQTRELVPEIDLDSLATTPMASIAAQPQPAASVSGDPL